MTSTLLRVFKLPRTSYQQIFSLQQQLRAARQANRVSDCLLLVEHDPVYTLGRHQNHANLLWPLSRIESELQVPVVRTDRGGDVTYHGPGVLCAYHVADLRPLHCTVKGYVERLEAVMIRTALHYGVRAYGGVPSMRGVWTDATHKLGSVGISVSRHVTMHGLAINIAPEWRYIEPIRPCGLHGVHLTSLRDCGASTDIEQVRTTMVDAFLEVMYGTENRQNVDVVQFQTREAVESALHLLTTHNARENTARDE